MLREPLAGRGAEWFDEVQIMMRRHDRTVTQVGRQGQDGVVEIHPLGIPAQEAPAGEGVPQVMDPRRTTRGARGAGQVRAETQSWGEFVRENKIKID